MGMEVTSASLPLQKIAKIPKKKLYFSRISVKTKDIYMFFMGKIKNLARNLLKVAPLFCLLGFLVFPQSGLFANEWDKPIVLLEEPLLPAIELRNGEISEVFIGSETELAIQSAGIGEGVDPSIGYESSTNSNPLILNTSANSHELSCLENSQELSSVPHLNCNVGPVPTPTNPEHFGVKSIASPGLFGFLGICLSRSELPSKNFSTPCENFPLKSMTQKSANDWKSSWQRVRTTSLWHMSTNSSRSLKNSILRPSRNLTPSMSDISSIWSNATGGFPMTSSPLSMSLEVKLQTLDPVKNRSNSKLLPLGPNQRRPVVNPTLL